MVANESDVSQVKLGDVGTHAIEPFDSTGDLDYDDYSDWSIGWFGDIFGWVLLPKNTTI